MTSLRVNDEINSTIKFPNIMQFNNTRVYCVALNKSGTTLSDVALMIIAGIANYTISLLNQ